MKVFIGDITGNFTDGYEFTYRCPMCGQTNTGTDHGTQPSNQLRGKDPITCSNCVFEFNARLQFVQDDGTIDLNDGTIIPTTLSQLTDYATDGAIAVEVSWTDVDDIEQRDVFYFHSWEADETYSLPAGVRDTITALHRVSTATTNIDLQLSGDGRGSFPRWGPHAYPLDGAVFDALDDDWVDYAEGPFRSEHPNLAV